LPHDAALNKRVLLLSGALLLAAGLLWLCLQDGRLWALFRDAERLRAWVLGWGVWAPLAVVVLQVVQVLVAPIPGQVVGLASGYLFGTAWGTFYSVVGTGLGSWMALVLARALGRPLVERLVPASTLRRLDAAARRRGLLFFLLVFLLPFLPDDAACFVAGLTPIPIPALMLTVLLGRPPGIWVSCWLGAHATGLGVAQWALVIAGSGVVALLLLFCGERLSEWMLAITERLSGQQ
jgi:uncharacterized membrane protein YdjX (TVP38/TMEM64 family)